MDTAPSAAARAVRWALLDSGVLLPEDAEVGARGVGADGREAEGWAAVAARVELTVAGTAEDAAALAALLGELGLREARAHAAGFALHKVLAVAGDAELAALAAGRPPPRVALDFTGPVAASRWRASRPCQDCGEVVTRGRTFCDGCKAERAKLARRERDRARRARRAAEVA